MRLFRLMKVADDGKPLVGTASMMLGVRPVDPTVPNKRADVPAVTAGDLVQPGDGGLSCYTDAAAIRLQPKNTVLWSIDVSTLPPELRPTAAGVPHYHLEPAVAMTLDQLQGLLAATRDAWHREDGGTDT